MFEGEWLHMLYHNSNSVSSAMWWQTAQKFETKNALVQKYFPN